MPLVIADSDPDWPRLAAREGAAVSGTLGGASVEHVGSTAVPGLDAAPTVDLLAGVASPDDVEASTLAAMGYVEAPRDGAGRVFWKGTPAFHTYHLHLVPAGGRVWDRYLAFRDRLRADLALAERYAHEKRVAVRQHAGDPDAYAAAKASFIDRALADGPV